MKENILNNFEHKMTAHCENGATRNLFNFHGIQLSEAMIFGIGSGLFFVHFPYKKLNGAPITSYRPMPGLIFSRVSKVLGANIKRKKFPRNQGKSMHELDKMLINNIPVGMLVGVYNLTYFPAPLRFHFNAHNIVAIKKEGNNYLVSDPVMENVESISKEDLQRVRYAKGTFRPNGRMYYIESLTGTFDLSKAIEGGIQKTCRMMLNYQGPFVGVRGIKYMSERIRKWPTKYPVKKASLYLASVIRMQEEIGTGGAGFRFLYAAFLQEAAFKLDNNELHEASKEMTMIGDLWRKFAIDSGRVCKLRTKNGESYDTISDILSEIADREKNLFSELLKLKLN